jgi:hypothetical protein
VAHNREGETMEETLRRLLGGPHLEEVAGILSPETADEVRERLEAKHERDAVDNRSLRKRFE